MSIQAKAEAVADCLKDVYRAQIHCENTEALVDAQERTFSQGFTGPEGHYISRPATLEVSSQPLPLALEPSLTQVIEFSAVKASKVCAATVPMLRVFASAAGIRTLNCGAVDRERAARQKF